MKGSSAGRGTVAAFEKACYNVTNIYTLFCAVKVDVDIYIISIVILGYEENTSCVEYSR